MKVNFKFLVLPLIAIVILHVILSIPIEVPIIWPDEYTYLFMAKYFSGEVLTQSIPKTEVVGSFGYSLLVSPAFRLFDDPISIYKSILVLNSFFAGLLYISVFLFIKKLTESTDKLSMLIGLVISLYPAYLLQSNNAYTDSLTPAYFLFCITAFFNYLDKKDIKSLIIFVVLSGFMNWIHIRMLPFTLITILIMSFLFYKKQINPLHFLVSIGVLSIFVLLGIIITDHVQFALQGKLEEKERIINSLLNIAEVILLLGGGLLIIYSLLNRRVSLIIFIITGILAGLFLSETLLSWLLLPIVVLLNYLIFKKDTSKIKNIIIGTISFIILALLTYIAIPELKFVPIVFDRLRIWFVNLSGVTYYSIFSTYLFVLIGFIGILYYLHKEFWHNGLPENPDSITDFSTVKPAEYNFQLLINNPKALTFIFMLLTSIGMIIITIFPKELSSTYYRADHLFYGRYIEVVIAGFFAYGLQRIIKAQPKEYLIITLASIFIFFSMSFLMIYVYGNVIASELSFKSVLSFFPLRAVLGNINIFLFSLYALVIGILFSIINRFKPTMGSILMSVGMLSTSIFTYYYVDYYYQIDKLERNKLINLIEDDFKNIKIVNYDLGIFTEKSQNGLHYIWSLPNREFNLFTPNKGSIKSELTIGGEYYGINNDRNAFLYAIEHDGNDHLWIEEGELQNKFEGKFPLYYNIPLQENYVKGVYRSKFYKDYWINGKWELIVPNIESDSAINFEVVMANSNDISQNMIIWLEDEEVFNKNIQPGVWKYTISLSTKDKLKRFKLRFFSDLTKDKDDKIIGIKLISAKLLKDSINKVYNFSFDNKLQNTIKIELRRNLDYKMLNLKSGDTLELPMLITNYGSNEINFDKIESYLRSNWYGFRFKSLKFQNQGAKLTGSLKPGEGKEYFMKLIVPENLQKYFVDFGIYDNDSNLLYKVNSKRQWLVDLRKKDEFNPN